MHRIPHGLLILLVSIPVVESRANEEKDESKRLTPAEQYQALLKEYEETSEGLSKAKTDAERGEFAARVPGFPLRFLELAEQHPKDPAAIDALIQTVSQVNGTAFPAGGNDSPGSRALALLQRDHLRSDKLGTVCQRVAFGFHRGHEMFLRAVLETSPHREVQALACLSLAQFLGDRVHRLNVLQDQDQGRSELADRYDRIYGKEFVAELLQQDRSAVVREAEALFARAADNYGDVKIPITYFGSGGTVGETANAELFQIRHLAVGRTAPDIEGEDQDGKRFQLSDYRGKVVLLDFWYHQ